MSECVGRQPTRGIPTPLLAELVKRGGWKEQPAIPVGDIDQRLEALERQLEVEVFSWTATPFGQLLWDLKTFLVRRCLYEVLFGFLRTPIQVWAGSQVSVTGGN